MNAPSVQSVGDAWAARAEELADWALARLFMRRDRYGGYIDEGKGLEKRNVPRAGSQPSVVTWALLTKHFTARSGHDVIGCHSLAPGTSLGRAANADIDAHTPEDDPVQNKRYAEHLYAKLAAEDFRPLAADYGDGSFHVGAIFDRDVPGDVLFSFGQWIVSDASQFGFLKPVESFPKQAAVPEDGFGNWLRLVGRHHKRNVWAKVFDGEQWLEGEDAVAHVLSLTGDDPALIPPEALPKSAEPDPPRNERETATGDQPDVFDAYKPTLSEVIELLESRGHKVIKRSAVRAEFTRAHKRGTAQSFNVQVIDGTPITWNFSSNAGLPEGKGLNPVHLRCYLEYGNTDTCSMKKLAAVLRKELGWPDPPGTQSTSTSAGAAPPEPEGAASGALQTGVEIILDYYRETYRPEFRRGNVVVSEDGEDIHMNVACAVSTSALITRLEEATDAPRYAGKDGQVGDVKKGSLPGFFAKWAKVAWGDLRNSLPDEDAAELGEDSACADTFRRWVREALLSELVLGDAIGGTKVTQTERRSLIDWCQKFAKPGPWRSIRSKKCWCKVTVDETAAEGRARVILHVAIRHELLSQVTSDKRLREMGANAFARRAARYGVGTSNRTDRPHGQSAIVLDGGFLRDLVDFVPADDKPKDDNGQNASIPRWWQEVYMFVCRKGPVTAERIANDTRYSPDEVREAIDHYLTGGLLIEDDGLFAPPALFAEGQKRAG